ncbi:pleckstrin homology domain-containing family J member 1 isoform 2-T2 [Dugong dugon]
MRYNEKELQALSRQPAEMAAELGMRGPKKGSVVKRRLVKLVVNFLFYFRTDEAEPIGALLLEHCRVTREEPSGFAITWRHRSPETRDHCPRQLKVRLLGPHTSCPPAKAVAGGAPPQRLSPDFALPMGPRLDCG